MTSAVIANDATDRYDRRTRRGRKPVETDPEWQDLKRRVDRGEWLSPSEAAKFLGVSRTKIHTMLKAKELRHKTKVGSKHRVVDPVHLLALYAGAEEVIGPADVDPPASD